MRFFGIYFESTSENIPYWYLRNIYQKFRYRDCIFLDCIIQLYQNKKKKHFFKHFYHRCTSLSFIRYYFLLHYFLLHYLNSDLRKYMIWNCQYDPVTCFILCKLSTMLWNPANSRLRFTESAVLNRSFGASVIFSSQE